MSKFKFHKLAAIVVLIVFAGWVATGAFSSVGSDAPSEEAKAAEQPKAEPAPIRTVKLVVPPRQAHARAIRI
ncbi:MAG: efflux transporter periplasmic adaptor subunit, partial [Mesorhizobium sp.]|nr:efflux transporter periplasmic adaptor subunit [Mesorhizobium sp.]